MQWPRNEDKRDTLMLAGALAYLVPDLRGRLIDVVRGKKPVTVTLDLMPAPAPGKDDIRNLSGKHPLDGARVSNVLPSVADELGLEDAGGVAVLSVRPGSTADQLGFRPGDLIAQVGGQRIDSVADLENAVRERQRVWAMAIRYSVPRP